MKADHHGVLEFMQDYGTVGSAGQIADYAFLGFNRSDFLEYRTLTAEAAKMLAHIVTDDAVRAVATGVDGPIQLAVVSPTEAAVLAEEDLQPIRDTATAFRMHQADFLKRAKVAGPEPGARGLLPGQAAD
jgi:hypothetical protein